MWSFLWCFQYRLLSCICVSKTPTSYWIYNFNNKVCIIYWSLSVTSENVCKFTCYGATIYFFANSLNPNSKIPSMRCVHNLKSSFLYFSFILVYRFAIDFDSRTSFSFFFLRIGRPTWRWSDLWRLPSLRIMMELLSMNIKFILLILVKFSSKIQSLGTLIMSMEWSFSLDMTAKSCRILPNPLQKEAQ